MLTRISHFLVGIGAIFVGFIIKQGGWSHHYGFSVPNEVGILFVIFGIMLILYGLFKKCVPENEASKFIICSECSKTFYAKDIPDQKCPKCNAKLEDMEGFYERHPELHDGEKSLNN